MAEEDTKDSNKTAWIIFLLSIPVLLFAPLLASFLENTLFGTDYVYHFFDKIGLAHRLDIIYDPIARMFFR